MPPANADDSATNCNCGPLEPQDGEKPIKDGTTADQILSKVQLICDDDTGVFFFRYNQQLYMRSVALSSNSSGT